MNKPDTEQPIVKAWVQRVQGVGALQAAQAEAAAKAVSTYSHVLAALEGTVPADQIHAIAATLTAGILSSAN